MTNKEMTRAQALEFAIDNIAANCMDDMEKTGANEAIKVLEKMHAQITKPRKTDDSKRLINMDLGAKFSEMWTEETFKASDIADALDISTQKASAVIRAMGWEAVPTTAKVSVYHF